MFRPSPQDGNESSVFIVGDVDVKSLQMVLQVPARTLRATCIQRAVTITCAATTNGVKSRSVDYTEGCDLEMVDFWVHRNTCANCSTQLL